MTKDILAGLIVLVFTVGLVLLIIKDDSVRQVATVIAQLLCLTMTVGAVIWALYRLTTRFFP